MPSIKSPRKGSMQYWPRTRANRPTARVRSWPTKDAQKILGFGGFKAGMTHIHIKDEKATSMTKGQEIPVPVTVLECPPMKVFGIRLYKKHGYGLRCVGQITQEKLDKELGKKIILPKKQGKEANTEHLADVRILAYTQPGKTGIGRKVPDVLEIGVGGKNAEEKLAFAKEQLGKAITINDVFVAGDYLDICSVTQGKGTQGPVKRFGVQIRVHKSEKTKRGPGSLGPWHGAKTYRVAHAGQMGYHQRTESNKQILFVSDEPEKINQQGGFINYGVVKNPFILIKGSLGGAKKRFVTLMHSRRIAKPGPAPNVTHISTTSPQG